MHTCIVYIQVVYLIELSQGFSNFLPGDPNFSLKSYATQNRTNLILPELMKGMSLLSFTEFIEVWGYFGHSTPKV